MNGWVESIVFGWTDGRVDTQMLGSSHDQMWMDGRMEERSNRWMFRWAGVQTGGCSDGQMDGWMCRWRD